MRNWRISIWALIGISVLIGIYTSGCSTVTSTATTTTTTTTATTTTTLTYSISGRVCFVSTAESGVKNVPVVAVVGLGRTASTTPDADTGTYSFSGLLPGYYTVIASKEGWTIPPIFVTVSGASKTDQNFVALPSNWVLVKRAGLDLDDITSMEGTDNALQGNMYAVGSNGIILKSEDGGSSWAAIPSPTTEALISASSWGPYGLGIVNRLAGSFSTTEANTQVNSWVYYGILTTESIADISFYSGTSWEVVTETGKVLRALNSGESFSDLDVGIFANDVQSISANDVVAVGDGGAARVYNGSSWSSLNVGTTEDLMAIFVRGTDGIITSSNGTIFRSTDSGNTWSEDLDGVPCSLRGVYIGPGNASAFVVGGDGLIMKRVF